MTHFYPAIDDQGWLRMEPALRRWYERMIPRLEAERAMLWAAIVRSANYSKEDFQNQINYWRQLADGAEVGNEIDARGRPMTDSLEDFVAFWKGDRRTLVKYGAV